MTSNALTEFLTHATTVAYVVLGLLALMHWSRQPNRQSGWLAATFLVLGIVLIAAEILPAAPEDDNLATVRRIVVAILLLFPYFLFRFSASFEKASPIAETFAGAMTALVVVWSFFVPLVPEGAPRPRELQMFVLVLLVQWVTLSLIVSIRLWRQGTAMAAPVAQRRMRLMSVAAAILSVVLIVGGAAEQQPLWLEVTTQLMTLAAAGVFYVAFSPPEWIRNAWRRPALEQMRRATTELLGAVQESDVTSRLLPHMAGIVGARGIAFFDSDGKLVDQHNVNPEMLGATDGRTQGDGEMQQWNDLVVMRFPFGCLAVWTSPYAPFFGSEEFSVLRSMGNIAHLAIEQTRAAELKLQVAEAKLRRRQALEINDNIVQGLAVAKYAFELGDDAKGKAALERSLASAKRIISDLLSELDEGEELQAGLLVRDRPASHDEERSAS